MNKNLQKRMKQFSTIYFNKEKQQNRMCHEIGSFFFNNPVYQQMNFNYGKQVNPTIKLQSDRTNPEQN